jgi:GntR family transcriptional regulator, transcriptional repressor for pyruvate dehydrogenase complex
MVQHMTITAPILARLNREKLNEKIVTRIKELIFANQLQIGHKLPSERELMAQTGVSRAVVREALRSLEQSGLVEIRQGATGGAFVVSDLEKPIFNSAYDLYGQGKLTLAHFVEIRKAIECLSARVAAMSASAADVSRLHDLNAAYLAEMDDELRHRRHAEAFHVAVAEVSGNHLSKLLVRALFRLLDTLRPDSVQSKKFKYETYMLHNKITEAIERRNSALCERLMARDIERTGMLEHSKVKHPGTNAGRPGKKRSSASSSRRSWTEE